MFVLAIMMNSRLAANCIKNCIKNPIRKTLANTLAITFMVFITLFYSLLFLLRNIQAAFYKLAAFWLLSRGMAREGGNLDSDGYAVRLAISWNVSSTRRAVPYGRPARWQAGCLPTISLSTLHQLLQ